MPHNLQILSSFTVLVGFPVLGMCVEMFGLDSYVFALACLWMIFEFRAVTGDGAPKWSRYLARVALLYVLYLSVSDEVVLTEQGHEMVTMFACVLVVSTGLAVIMSDNSWLELFFKAFARFFWFVFVLALVGVCTGISPDVGHWIEHTGNASLAEQPLTEHRQQPVVGHGASKGLQSLEQLEPRTFMEYSVRFTPAVWKACHVYSLEDFNKPAVIACYYPSLLRMIVDERRNEILHKAAENPCAEDSQSLTEMDKEVYRRYLFRFSASVWTACGIKALADLDQPTYSACFYSGMKSLIAAEQRGYLM